MNILKHFHSQLKHLPKKKGHCDLHLDMTEMTVPDEAQDMFLTVYLKQKNRLQIVSSLGPKELNNYIWVKDN